jgi:CheY-like chemotaxis protein
MQRTIVLAEDSKTVRRMVEIALARHPFTLAVAEDGESALGAVRNQKPALVLVDTALPGIDGYELTRRIKADAALGDVRVLLLAGFNQRLDEGRARQVGADGHVTKPFLTQDLLDAVYKVTTGELAPDGDLFRNQGPKVPLARKATPAPAKPPAPPAPAEKAPVAAAPSPAPSRPAPAPAPAAPPPAPAANPFQGVSSPFDGAETTRPFLRREQTAPEAEPGAPAQIDDEALRRAVAAVARDVIERIVWEVVPPLAEALLKEEIARVVRERLVD